MVLSFRNFASDIYWNRRAHWALPPFNTGLAEITGMVLLMRICLPGPSPGNLFDENSEANFVSEMWSIKILRSRSMFSAGFEIALLFGSSALRRLTGPTLPKRYGFESKNFKPLFFASKNAKREFIPKTRR